MAKVGILLVQLGSPKSPSTADVKTYLGEFLGDPRLIRNQNLAWKLLLNGIILPTRSPKSAEAYASIWTEAGSPLAFNTTLFYEKVKQNLPQDLPCEYAFVIGSGPRVPEAFDRLIEQGVEEIKVVPLFPQFAEGTSLSVADAVEKSVVKCDKNIKWSVLQDFHLHPAYINNLARMLKKEYLEGSFDKVLISFHGYPKDRVFLDQDPYYCHCIRTAQAIVAALPEIPPDDFIVAFQSQFGRKEWVSPSTLKLTKALPSQGVKNLLLICPAFTVDNLETLEEIDQELREEFFEAGGEIFNTVPCLNDDEKWCKDFAHEIVLDTWVASDEFKNVELNSTQFVLEKLKQKVKISKELNLPSQSPAPENLSADAKSTLKIMFLILFLDLAGFSIIFPLFPAMLDHYLEVDGQSGIIVALVAQLKAFSIWAGADSHMALVVLFGGLLSFLYSLLQFVGAPYFGYLSDRFGRKPVLFVSMGGIALSYLMWGFAGSFGWLILSRFIGGLMGSNITTATAVVADITTERTRSKGMAVIGISFGLGFLFGPAIGGLATKINLMEYFPSLVSWGLNPFSAPAFIAFALSMVAWHLVYHKFKESLPKEKRGKGVVHRTINPLKMFKSSQYPGAHKAALSNFFFLLFFSGCEFTLTFLTFERLGYSPSQNGLMFVFIGFVLIMVQGGYVRRQASVIGEKAMAKKGLLFLVPALLILSFASNSWWLYFGLLFMGIGSAMVIPTTTALASFGVPNSENGRVLGVFRSLGALGRTFGPLLACMLYWKFSSAMPYIVSTFALFLPFYLVSRIKRDSASPKELPQKPNALNPLGLPMEKGGCPLRLADKCYCK